jgi:polysaccharide biosynthesis protein PslH
MKWLSSREDTGGKIRSFRLGKALASFARVDAAGFVLPGDRIDGGKEHLSHYDRLYSFPIQRAFGNPLNFLSGIARGLSLRSARFFSSSSRRFVEKILRENRYDAIQVEELSLMSSLGSLFLNFPVIYSSHNVESQLSSMIFNHRNFFLKFLSETERRRTAAEERRALSFARACLAVSEKDRSILKRLSPQGTTPVYVLPNCANDRFKPSAQGVAGKEILSAGCFGWYPNEEGMMWFVNEVLPRLREQVPGPEITVAGSEIGCSLGEKFKQSGIRICPDVPDMLPFLQNARLLIVPLRIGGGTRIKIIEAWAAGLPVVSTSIGADGLPCRPGVDILIADDPVQFAGAIHKILTDDDLYQKLWLEGLKNSKNLRWSGLSTPLKEIYQTCGINS